MSSHERLKSYIDKLEMEILMFQYNIINIEAEIQSFNEKSQTLQRDMDQMELSLNDFSSTRFLMTLAIVSLCATCLIWNLFKGLQFKLVNYFKRMKILIKFFMKKPEEAERDANIDRVASYNMNMFLLNDKIKVNEYLLRNSNCSLTPKNKQQVKCHSLRKCGGVCGRELSVIKREGESFKITECGHVICARCSNRHFIHDFHCPACNHNLKRDGIIRVTNLYL